VPLGAIINGREHARRLVESYGFSDLADHRLELCTDWVEFLRCFEHLASYVQHATPAPAAQPMTDEQVAHGYANCRINSSPASVWFEAGIRHAEAHHGINAQASEGGA
jgi:hypothetical protein